MRVLFCVENTGRKEAFELLLGQRRAEARRQRNLDDAHLLLSYMRLGQSNLASERSGDLAETVSGGSVNEAMGDVQLYQIGAAVNKSIEEEKERTYNYRSMQHKHNAKRGT